MDNLFVKGVPSCGQCNYSHTVKMRYQNEIEEIFKISEEFGSKIKKTNILYSKLFMGRKIGKTMTLHHLATNLQI